MHCDTLIPIQQLISGVVSHLGRHFKSTIYCILTVTYFQNISNAYHACLVPYISYKWNNHQTFYNATFKSGGCYHVKIEQKSQNYWHGELTLVAMYTYECWDDETSSIPYSSMPYYYEEIYTM